MRHTARRLGGAGSLSVAAILAWWGYGKFGWFFVHVALPELPITSLTWLLTFGSCCVILCVVASLAFASYRLLGPIPRRTPR